MPQTKVGNILTHLRIRRDVLKRLYYEAKKPLPTMADGRTQDERSVVWGELMGLDCHVLQPAADAGLIPKDWPCRVPASSTDNGGFDPEYLAEYLA